MAGCTALSFGALAAVMVSMKDFVGGDAQFTFSWATVVAFALGCLVGALFWYGVGLLLRKANHQSPPDSE